MPSTVVSKWPTNTATTTTMANLLVPSKLPSTLNVPTVPKPSASSQPSKSWPRPYTPVPLSSLVYSDWSSEEDWDSTKQKERKRLDKTIKEQQRKIAEERRKKREEESAQLYLPNPINTKPNSSLINPLVQNPRREGKEPETREK